MNDQTWIFGKAISPFFADRVTIYSLENASRGFFKLKDAFQSGFFCEHSIIKIFAKKKQG